MSKEVKEEPGAVQHTDAQSREWQTLFSGVAKGSELNAMGMAVSASLCQPVSGVEKNEEGARGCAILEELLSAVSDEDEMIVITRSLMMGVIKQVFDGKKPLNPILGETIVGMYKGKDFGSTFFVVEQVSHHPPRTAAYSSNDKVGVKETLWYEGKAHFYGNSLQISFVGQWTIKLKNGHTYTASIPALNIRGLFFGSRGIESVGIAAIK